MTDQNKNNVRAIHGGDLPPDQILDYAKEADLGHVVVIGWRREPDEDGKKFYVAASMADADSAIYAIQQANLHVLRNSGGEFD